MNYQKIYDQICQRAKLELEQRKANKKNGGYYEGHHIVPKCLGGEGSRKNWNHENITPLTAREHFLCHLILTILYPDNRKLIYALSSMIHFKSNNQLRYIPNSRIYEYIKKDFSKKISGENHPMYGKDSGMKGKKHTKESIEKMRISQLGKKASDQTKQKMSNSSKRGIPRSEEIKQKISISNKGKIKTYEAKQKMSISHKGKKFSEDHKNKISLSLIGKKRLNYVGENNPKSKKLLDIDNGLKFNSIKEAISFYNISRHTINKWIKSGKKFQYL